MATFVSFSDGIFNADFTTTALTPFFYVLLCTSILWHFLPRALTSDPFRQFFVTKPAWVQAAAYSIILIVLSGMAIDTPQFLYFQF